MKMLRQGFCNDYHWLWAPNANLNNIVKLAPEIIKDKFIAISSCDSGPYKPTNEELSSGWIYCNGVSISPKIDYQIDLPIAGWDEWYVISEQRIPFPPKVFVSYTNFSLAPGETSADKESFRFASQLLEDFWSQLATFKPLSFIADNEIGFSFVTDNIHVFKKVCEAIKNTA
jgi:hypothetical protein